jgi:hypothetical protein
MILLATIHVNGNDICKWLVDGKIQTTIGIPVGKPTFITE